ncbi:MAG: DNA methyltransferase [Dehalococcoidia bacterium]
MEKASELLTISQASKWASENLGRNVTTSNISYLIQYGRIKKAANNGKTLIDKKDLVKYYQSHFGKRENDWTNRIGDDLNWSLSFDHLKESDRTKHVHRLHPYKGKFIPQLVEYFLDSHADEAKTDVCFNKGDIVLDPFCGSGTTLVQANELGMHAIGIDVSSFNALISNVKINKYNLVELYHEARRITSALKEFTLGSNAQEFEDKLMKALTDFNNRYFPSPDFKVSVRRGEINEDYYGQEKAAEFKPIYLGLINQYNIALNHTEGNNFLDKWYIAPVRSEIVFVRDLIEQVQDVSIRNALVIILSRTIRSCRATTHFDLATLKEPISYTYYCHKHGKICKPLFSILGWWIRYSQDAIQRLIQFDKLRTKTTQICLTGDSRSMDIAKVLEQQNHTFAKFMTDQKIKGIFSSPPYVGLIDYHDQHAYAYDVFHFERRDHLEIGTLSKGQGLEAREAYIESISQALKNCRRFLSDSFHIFLVANDKYNMYPAIAQKSELQIVNQFKRPVLCRTERDKGAYSETIFHLKAH